jgi:hypothetical protein
MRQPRENRAVQFLQELLSTKEGMAPASESSSVEPRMNRHLSPALVTQYETQMISKAILRQKLHEWSQLLHK